uniref:Uncharacterized protein n=1 Tax=Romanomermis culicivorax TaxID=13658 RepID=A0A915JZW5_ROMCU
MLFYTILVIINFLVQEAYFSGLQANGQPCPIVVVPTGLNLGGNLGLNRGAGFNWGNPAAWPAYNMYPSGVGAAWPSSYPVVGGSRMVQPAFNARDYGTYPNTFDPSGSVGGGLGSSYGLDFGLTGTHAVVPASAVGYTGCD